MRVKLTLAEIAAGTVKKLKINKQIACPKCGGTGAKDANSYSTCSTCNGAGYVNRVENTFSVGCRPRACVPRAAVRAR